MINLNKQETIELLKEYTKQNIIDIHPRFKIEPYGIFHLQSEWRMFDGIDIVVEKEVDIGLAGFVKEICPIAFEGWYDYTFQASTLTLLNKE